ncbi:hypothetical protein NDU88_000303 [Pleurodeles waltl]|uniref:Uncharacterized protein n=1 Tax=Pleurodeles waltl TaxID=8319 RepID=A0AAV7TEK1_PLEWA|nr:hypothetical protein NDU88_000303 [Pleurodeles waltl]
MAGYEDQADDGYYLVEPAGSFEQYLVYALDAGVRHTVNQALAQAIKPIKHHLLGFAEQQGWVAPSGIQSIMEPSLSAGTQATKQREEYEDEITESIVSLQGFERPERDTDASDDDDSRFLLPATKKRRLEH